MDSAEIYRQLTELFRELFADDSIALTAETTANHIEGWDSFNHISVIVAVETRFGVKMTTSEIEHLANVGALVAAIESKLSGGAGGPGSVRR
jgi:acyl carrier protein